MRGTGFEPAQALSYWISLHHQNFTPSDTLKSSPFAHSGTLAEVILRSGKTFDPNVSTNFRVALI